jgi:AcrR family transcriptional regulator
MNPPRPDVSEERKTQILGAALRVFIRQGIHQTRMDDIVEETGLSKGALYWYFSSKDEIIAAIVNRMFESELSSLVALKSAPGTVRERLLAYTERAAHELETQIHLRPVLYEFYALSTRNEAVRSAMQTQFGEYIKALAPLLEDGIRQGEFRPLNAADVAIVAAAMFEGVQAVRMYDPQVVQLSRYIPLGITLLLDGLKAGTP